jgi:hypothetical protein
MNGTVIPGRPEGASPEPINTTLIRVSATVDSQYLNTAAFYSDAVPVMGSGLLACARPRNDGVGARR